MLAIVFIISLSIMTHHVNGLNDCTKIANANAVCLDGPPAACNKGCVAQNCTAIGGKCRDAINGYSDRGTDENCPYKVGGDNYCLLKCHTIFEEHGPYCFAYYSKDFTQDKQIGLLENGNPIKSDSVILYDRGAVCNPAEEVPATSGTGKPVLECIYANRRITGDTQIVLNVGDTLMIQCKAHGVASMSTIDNDRIPGFIVAKNLPPTSVYVKLATPRCPPSLSIDRGYLVYNTITGNSFNYDHIIVRGHMPFYERPLVASGYVSMFIPYLMLADAATYYIGFMDGADYTNVDDSSSLGMSYAINVQVNTKANTGINSRTASMLATSTSLIALPAVYMLN